MKLISARLVAVILILIFSLIYGAFAQEVRYFSDDEFGEGDFESFREEFRNDEDK